MTVVPALSAFRIPLVDPIVATIVLPLLQEPPIAALLKVADEPAQRTEMPEMTDDDGLTVTIFIAVQPDPREYVIVTVPAAMPEIIPDVIPAVAIVVLLLVHDPPMVASLRVVFRPTQTLVTPVIGDGAELIVIAVPDLQPAGDV